MSLPARPSDAVALFEHLAQWGELSAYEAEDLGAGPWVSVFENAGALEAVHDEHGRPVAWHLTPPFVHLVECDAQQAGRRLCFAVPEYRAYLLSILVEGLVDAGRTGMTVELEEWTKGELAPLLAELNAFLGPLEGGKRLVDFAPAELEARMADLPERSQPFAAWDSYALGHSARPKGLFEFALRRFGPASVALPVAVETAAVLRPLPLNREDGFGLGSASIPQPWNTQRFGVLSGAPIVDARGQRMFDEDAPLNEVLLEHLRDAVVEHPFYAAVIHLGICAWRSPASTIPTVELYVPASGGLHDVSVLVGSRGVGRVAELLGDLVRAQGYAPFGLVDGRVPDELMGNLLRNLLELRVLRHQDELLVLDDRLPVVADGRAPPHCVPARQGAAEAHGRGARAAGVRGRCRMRPRKVDLAFDWMRSQPRRAFHYRDEVWAALAELHPDEFAVSDDRKTPWFSLHRDMTQDARFLRGDKGMFELVEGATLDDVPSAEVVAVPDVKEPRVWIFQANPKLYRILEALQHLDRMQFLTNRYKDRIHVGDIVLLWMSGQPRGHLRPGSCRGGRRGSEVRWRRCGILGGPEQRSHDQAPRRARDREAVPRQPAPQDHHRGHGGAGQPDDPPAAERHQLPRRR